MDSIEGEEGLGMRLQMRIGYTPRARLLSDLATECRRHEVAKSLGNQARGVQPACTMTTQKFKNQVDK